VGGSFGATGAGQVGQHFETGPASGDDAAPGRDGSSVDIMNSSDAVHGVAIVGMAGRFPGAHDIGAFWDNLRRGVESITFFTPEELIAAGVKPELVQDPNYVR